MSYIDSERAKHFASALAEYACKIEDCRSSEGSPCVVCEAKYYLRQNGFHLNASGRWVPPSE